MVFFSVILCGLPMREYIISMRISLYCVGGQKRHMPLIIFEYPKKIREEGHTKDMNISVPSKLNTGISL